MEAIRHACTFCVSSRNGEYLRPFHSKDFGARISLRELDAVQSMAAGDIEYLAGAFSLLAETVSEQSRQEHPWYGHRACERDPYWMLRCERATACQSGSSSPNRFGKGSKRRNNCLASYGFGGRVTQICG